MPQHCSYMGAIGIAEITREHMEGGDSTTKFRGKAILDADYSTKITRCDGCENACELLSLYADGRLLAISGSRCGEKNR